MCVENSHYLNILGTSLTTVLGHVRVVVLTELSLCTLVSCCLAHLDIRLCFSVILSYGNTLHMYCTQYWHAHLGPQPLCLVSHALFLLPLGNRKLGLYGLSFLALDTMEPTKNGIWSIGETVQNLKILIEPHFLTFCS